jgi:type II secretory pathway component PulF
MSRDRNLRGNKHDRIKIRLSITGLRQREQRADAAAEISAGESMAMPLEASGVFPEMAISMMEVGEETGAFPDMLTRVADTYDEEVDTTVEGLTSVIEPGMIVLVAFVVGTIVIAMFAPLIEIIEGLMMMP